MKALHAAFKKSALFAASILTSVVCFAQKPVTFKMEYLPERKYVMAVDMKMDMLMDLKGDSAAAIRAKSPGTFPMKMASNNQMEMEVRSGKRAANAKKFQLNMKYNKVETHVNMNGSEMPSTASPLNGMEIIGWAGGEALFEVDTTSNNKGTAGGITTATIGKMLNNMMQQIKFPAKPMQVGETFDQTLDMAIPVPGMPMKFNGKTTYKLIAVNNGIADFDMVASGSMDMKTDAGSGMNMKATITGTGKLKFSEADHFFTEMTNDMTMQYEMVVNNNTMGGDMKMQSTYKVNITPNAGK